jgi:hypothetical protein
MRSLLSLRSCVPSPSWKGQCVREEDDKELSSKRIKGVPDSQWCNAFWVQTKDTNRSSALLRYVVRCTAYGNKGTVLGTGVSDDTAPDMYTVKLDPVSELGSFATSYTGVRVPNVKLDDVSRVECQALIR